MTNSVRDNDETASVKYSNVSDFKMNLAEKYSSQKVSLQLENLFKVPQYPVVVQGHRTTHILRP